MGFGEDGDRATLLNAVGDAVFEALMFGWRFRNGDATKKLYQITDARNRSGILIGDDIGAARWGHIKLDEHGVDDLGMVGIEETAFSANHPQVFLSFHLNAENPFDGEIKNRQCDDPIQKPRKETRKDILVGILKRFRKGLADDFGAREVIR